MVLNTQRSAPTHISQTAHAITCTTDGWRVGQYRLTRTLVTAPCEHHVLYGDTHESAICCCALARATAISTRSLRSLTHHASGNILICSDSLYFCLLASPRLRSIRLRPACAHYDTRYELAQRQRVGGGKEMAMARSWRWRGADVGEELALARRLREADVGEELASPHCVTASAARLSSRLVSLRSTRLRVSPALLASLLLHWPCQLPLSALPRPLVSPAPLASVGRCCLPPARASPRHASPSDLAMPLRLATSTRHVASPTHLARLQLVQPAPSWGSVLVHALQLTRR